MPSFNPDLFRLAREERGLSQKALADALKVAQSEISKIESGKKVPGEAFVGTIAAFFGYAPEFFAQTDLALPEGGILHRKRSTLSATERNRLVRQFQTGSEPLFLISLKAGGLGLNLTAADYVIHLDPWWNPAIEDQASDRAHRIGQERPVTVYRLISAGTIEEKIIRLHQNKRSMADALLQDADMFAQISADDVIRLLREGVEAI